MKIILAVLAALFLSACRANPPVTVLRPIRVFDDSVWLSRAVPVGRSIVVGDDEIMKVLAFDGMRADGAMFAHVQRGMVGTMVRHHGVGEPVRVAR